MSHKDDWPKNLNTSRLLRMHGVNGERYRYLAAVAPVIDGDKQVGRLYMFKNMEFYYHAAYKTLFWLLCMALALYFAAWLSGYLLRPLRKLFVQGEVRAHHFVGKTAVVRTSRVDAQFGEAMVNDGGAGLIVQVRSVEPLAQGERVVLLQFDAQKHVYHVVRELEDNEQERS